MYNAMELRKQSSQNSRRALLDAKLGELSQTFQDRSGLTIQNSADLLDTIAMATDRDLLVQRMNMSARVLSDVRSALSALNSGAYGLCEDCDETISDRRLDAIPWARVCVTCQERRDRSHRADANDDNLSLAA
jgi:DnaK suppressor protein